MDGSGRHPAGATASKQSNPVQFGMAPAHLFCQTFRKKKDRPKPAQ